MESLFALYPAASKRSANMCPSCVQSTCGLFIGLEDTVVFVSTRGIVHLLAYLGIVADASQQAASWDSSTHLSQNGLCMDMSFFAGHLKNDGPFWPSQPTQPQMLSGAVRAAWQEGDHCNIVMQSPVCSCRMETCLSLLHTIRFRRCKSSQFIFFFLSLCLSPLGSCIKPTSQKHNLMELLYTRRQLYYIVSMVLDLILSSLYGSRTELIQRHFS